MHVLPIVDGNRTFIEWLITFEAVPGEVETWRALLLTLIPEWTDSLRRALARRDSQAPSPETVAPHRLAD